MLTYQMATCIPGCIYQAGSARFLGYTHAGLNNYYFWYFRVKKSLPEDFKKKPEATFMTALVSASFATAMCYPLDTARRQMQMKGSPFNSFMDAIPGFPTYMSLQMNLEG